MRRFILSRQAGFTKFEILVLLGMLAVIALIVVPQTVVPGSGTARIRTDHRSLAMAIESYYVDHKSYPTMRPFASNPEIDTRKFRKSGGVDLSFIEPGGAGLEGLTTPVAYVTSLFPDPHAPVKGMPFAYWVPKDGKGWMLISPGPDRVYSLAPAQLETVYDTSIPQPSALLLAGGGPRGAFTYDPTNGTESAGDLWRVKQ